MTYKNLIDIKRHLRIARWVPPILMRQLGGRERSGAGAVNSMMTSAG